MTKGSWGWALVAALGCERESPPPPLPAAAATVLDTQNAKLPDTAQEPPPSRGELIRRAGVAPIVLERVTAQGIKDRTTGVSQSICMARFMAAKRDSESARQEVLALPDDVPGKQELLDATSDVIFCINCGESDPEPCVRVQKQTAAGKKLLAAAGVKP